jgi:hypothetical protein
MSSVFPFTTQVAGAAFSLPHCCVSCFVAADHELPPQCILMPCMRHRRGGGGQIPLPFAIGAPLPDGLPRHPSRSAILAERGRYLLDYGADVVARLAAIDVAGATQLHADLTVLQRSLSTTLQPHTIADLRDIVRRIDEAVALAELAIRDAEDRGEAS